METKMEMSLQRSGTEYHTTDQDIKEALHIWSCKCDFLEDV